MAATLILAGGEALTILYGGKISEQLQNNVGPRAAQLRFIGNWKLWFRMSFSRRRRVPPRDVTIFLAEVSYRNVLPARSRAKDFI